MRTRYRLVLPPHIPNSTLFSKLEAKHSCNTGQVRQIACACLVADRVFFSGKNSSVGSPRHDACGHQSESTSWLSSLFPKPSSQELSSLLGLSWLELSSSLGLSSLVVVSPMSLRPPLQSLRVCCLVEIWRVRDLFL